MRWLSRVTSMRRVRRPAATAFEIARKGPARPRGIPATETIMSYDVDIGDDIGEVAATNHLLDELALYGYRPFDDEPDQRPLPEARIASGAVADMFDALIATLQDTRLEPEDRKSTRLNSSH